jgi:hypothetical protein
MKRGTPSKSMGTRMALSLEGAPSAPHHLPAEAGDPRCSRSGTCGFLDGTHLRAQHSSAFATNSRIKDSFSDSSF